MAINICSLRVYHAFVVAVLTKRSMSAPMSSYRQADSAPHAGDVSLLQHTVDIQQVAPSGPEDCNGATYCDQLVKGSFCLSDNGACPEVLPQCAADVPIEFCASELSYATPSFRWNIMDMKVSVSKEHKLHNKQNRVHKNNAKNVLRALVNQTKTNGLRMPMIPLKEDPSTYSDVSVHEKVYQLAEQLGMIIFASPMPDTKEGWTQTHDWSDERFVKWIIDYVKYFSRYGTIHYLGPWNEPYLMGKSRVGLADRTVPLIRSALKAAGFSHIMLVGPDEVKLDSNFKSLETNSPATLFDVIGTHSQTEDTKTTVAGWRKLMDMAMGKPVWNTEGMSVSYYVGNDCTGREKNGKLEYPWCVPSGGSERPPLHTAVCAGAEGWVWWGINNMLDVKPDGGGKPRATPGGEDVAFHLMNTNELSSDRCKQELSAP